MYKEGSSNKEEDFKVHQISWEVVHNHQQTLINLIIKIQINSNNKIYYKIKDLEVVVVRVDFYLKTSSHNNNKIKINLQHKDNNNNYLDKIKPIIQYLLIFLIKMHNRTNNHSNNNSNHKINNNNNNLQFNLMFKELINSSSKTLYLVKIFLVKIIRAKIKILLSNNRHFLDLIKIQLQYNHNQNL